ncbi:MAG: hypothetical protein RJA44_1136 [Pseudomonadota bacterium]
MTNTVAPAQDETPQDGTRRLIDQVERVYYSGYWIRTYPVPADTLEAKKKLIEGLTRRLFNHTEYGLNVPGVRLKEARAAYETETDPARRRVKGGMLAGALFNRATDIFRRLVELQAEGIDVMSDYPLLRECGRCLMEAMELGRMVLHRSGEEGLDELWGEPFKAFSIPVEQFYESRYIKIGMCMRDIDTIADAMVQHFATLPGFAPIGPKILDFSAVARTKTEMLRTDGSIFDVWARFVTAGERLADFRPALAEESSSHHLSDGLELIRRGRDLIFYIARARTPMPKSTREYIERCDYYRLHGRKPPMPAPLPA